MKLGTAVFLFVLLAASPGSAQLVKYDILLFNERIGTVVITKKTVGDTAEIYMLESRTKANFLWIKRENYTRYDVVYRHGQLYSSEAKEIENGKLKRWNKVLHNGQAYEVEGNKGKTLLNGAIVFSVVKMFFENGTKQQKLFYESEAEVTSLKQISPGTMEYKGSDGSRNVYVFQDGRLVAAETHVSIASVKLVPSN
ncbi:MAG: hypothetical protein KIS94_14885 [Chitinophagales bacterium]|nr:hypothetical protein [Chitinophagales bacterium]